MASLMDVLEVSCCSVAMNFAAAERLRSDNYYHQSLKARLH